MAIIALTTAAANATDTSQEMVDATWAYVFETRQLVWATVFSGIAVAGVAAVIGATQYFTQKRQHVIQVQQTALQEKQIEMQQQAERSKHLQEIMNTLSTSPMTDYRRTVFDWYCRLRMQDKPLVFNTTPALRKQADDVEGAFDRIAVLVLNNSVDYEEFFKLYHYMVLKAWVALEKDIDAKAKVNIHAGENFRALVAKIKERVTEMPEIDCSKVDPR